MQIEFAPIDNNRKVNPYRKRTPDASGNYNLCYVYNVEGTPEEIAAYKAANPKAVTDEKTSKALYITTRFVGKSCIMAKSEKGFFPDTRDLDMYANLEEQWGPTIAAQKMAELKTA